MLGSILSAYNPQIEIVIRFYTKKISPPYNLEDGEILNLYGDSILETHQLNIKNNHRIGRHTSRTTVSAITQTGRKEKSPLASFFQQRHANFQPSIKLLSGNWATLSFLVSSNTFLSVK